MKPYGEIKTSGSIHPKDKCGVCAEGTSRGRVNDHAWRSAERFKAKQEITEEIDYMINLSGKEVDPKNFLQEFKELCEKYEVYPELKIIPLFNFIKPKRYFGFPLVGLFAAYENENGDDIWTFTGVWPG